MVIEVIEVETFDYGLIRWDMGCSGNGQDGQDQITACKGARHDLFIIHKMYIAMAE